MKNNIATITTLSLAGITACAGLVLTSSYVSADDVVDDVSIEVPTSCSMSGSGMASHTAEVANGTYRADIGTTTINVLCNDYAGFSIYAAGYTGEEIGGTNSNKLVGTNVSSNATIDTGTATSGNTSNWAMKLATDSQATYPMTLTTGYDAYHAVPNEYTKVATRLTGTDVGTGAVGSTLTTTYAAYISQTQPADTYSGKVKYTLVHPNTETPPAPVTSLCAPGQIEMQNVANWQAGVTTGNEVTACDNRDGKTYSVARLADGNLWMTQNLDHDIDTTRTYTSQDTDISANWTPVASTHAANDTEWGEYSESTNPDGGDRFHAESYDPGELYWNGTIKPKYEDQCTAAGGAWNGWACIDPVLTADTGDSHYHLGNFYNWTAAVAMNDSSSYTTEGTLVEQSICPAGWTLPRVGDGEDTVEALWSEYHSYIDTNGNYVFDTGESALWTSPLYFVPSTPSYVGDSGDIWTPVVYDSYWAYYPNFDTNSYFGIDYDGERDYGRSVRCIARPVSSTVILN